MIIKVEILSTSPVQPKKFLRQMWRFEKKHKGVKIKVKWRV